MSAGATTERVLDSLRRLLVDETLRPGDRLDPALLAERLAASATPVREALHLLTGEGLVESRSGGGFILPFLDAPGLQDRYAWSGQVLALAIRTWPRRRRAAMQPDHAFAAKSPETDELKSLAERCGETFLRIGRRSMNSEHARAIHRLNARLHRARLAESEVIAGLDEEWAEVMHALRGGERETMLRVCASYHRRRYRSAADIVRAICRGS